MKIDELEQKINNLADMQQLIDSTVKFHITIFWTIQAFVVAVLGVALYQLAKRLFDKAMDKKEKEFLAKLDEIEKNIRINLKEEMPIQHAFDLVMNGRLAGRNAIILDLENLQLPNDPHKKPKIFFQPKGYKDSFEVHYMNLTNQYCIINKAGYIQSINCLIVDGVFQKGPLISSAVSESEAKELIKKNTQ
ncbi:hypothetical protein OOZ25_02820 [Bacillus subtilis]|uniref:hypothetical protein n=1 Tax=Bacillus subtilis TaxID=1423 RepID=UPI0025548D50|nr:hypothetical protein [Bacillus subtilis]MDL2028250.1 hypothetical protein [Bacillus subtilis]